MFVTINPATGTPATTHEVLALAMIATLKQTADYNISNKLLKVGYQNLTCLYNPQCINLLCLY